MTERRPDHREVPEPDAMHIRADGGDLSFQLLHSTPADRPDKRDLHVELNVVVGRYSVRDVRAWLEWLDVEAFMAELSELVRSLKGEARLVAMSPEDLDLTVEAIDAKGHFGVTVSVSSRLDTPNGQFPCALSGGFEMELSQVEALLQWLGESIRGPRGAQ